LVGYLRNGFLSLMAPELVQLPSQRIDALADQARRLGPPGLVRGIEHLGVALSEMRHAPDPRVLLDVATVQLTSDSVAPDLGALLVRLERVEKQLADGVSSLVGSAAGSATESASTRVDPTTGRAALGGRARQSVEVQASEPTEPEPSEPSEPSEPPEVPTAPAGGEAISIETWENTVRPSLRGMARAVYAPAVFVGSTESSLTLSVPNAAHLGKCEQNRSAVEKALSDLVGSNVSVELIDGGGGSGGVRSPRGDDGTVAKQQTDEPKQENPAKPSSESPDIDSRGGADAEKSQADPPPAPELQHEGDIDLDELVDAPPESVKTPINRLAEAFPGSELIEERG